MVTVGIDFGFSSIRVAYFFDENDGDVAKVDVLFNDLGDRSTPTTISFDGKLRIFGREAITNGALYPKNFVFGIKRIVGRRANDEDLESHLKRCFFRCERNNNERLLIDIECCGLTRTPEEVLSFIFCRIKEMGEQELLAVMGEAKIIEKAVISVPTYFTHNQRQSVINAAKIADIEVVQLINDSTAAAVNYVFDILEGESKKLLIFDFGASSLDVSVVDVNNFDITVVAASGSTSLGGVDFDNRLLDHCIRYFVTEHKLNVDDRLKHKLRTECEKAKITLQSRSDARVKIDISDNKELHMSVRRDEFESMCDDLFKKVMLCVKKVIAESKLKKTEMDEIIVIGGSSRLKKIENLMKVYFKGQKLNRRLNVDEAVATGAALWAASVAKIQNEKLEKLSITQVTPFRVGYTKTFVSDYINGTTNGYSLKLNRLPTIFIDRNTKLPASQESEIIESYINVIIGDGDKILKFDSIMYLSLHTGSSDLGKTPITLKLHININGMYEFYAKPTDLNLAANLNREQYYTTSRNFHLSDDEVRAVKEKLQEYKAHVSREEDRVKAKNNLENWLNKLKQRVTSSKDYLLPEDYSKLIERITSKKVLIDQNSSVSMEELKNLMPSLTKLEDDYKHTLEMGETMRRKTFKALKSAVLTMVTNYNDAKYIVGEDVIKNIASSIPKFITWVHSNQNEKISILEDKIKEVKSIEEVIDSLKTNEFESRRQLFTDLMKFIENTKLISPFKAYEKLPQYEKLNRDLEDEILRLKIKLTNHAEVTSETLSLMKQRLQEFIETKKEKIEADEKVRKTARNQFNEALCKIKEFSNDLTKARVPNNCVESINQIKAQAETWLLNNTYATKDEFEGKTRYLWNEFEKLRNLIHKDTQLRESAMKELSDELSKLPKLINGPRKSRITRACEQKINRIIHAANEWILKNKDATKETLDGRRMSLKKELALINNLIQREDDRVAAKNELYGCLLNFSQTFFGPNEKKFNKSEYEELKDQIQSLLEWHGKNEDASEESFKQKIQIVDDLTRTANSKIREKEIDDNCFVGIDIGTSYCCLSVLKNGEYEVISLSDNCVRLPSFVAYLKNDFVSGSEAKNNIFDNPSNTYYNIKRLMGRRKDKYFFTDLKYLTYSVDHGTEKLKVEEKSAKYYSKKFNVEEITALLLLKMKLAAEEYLKKDVSSVSISVPPLFRNSQRRSIYNAAIIAGFKNVKLVNDTVALTMKHLWDNAIYNKDNNKKLLVFSMGAGYTSVSVIEVTGNCIEVKAHNGANFGGIQFDNCLYDHIIGQLFPKKEMNISQSIHIHMNCERAKISLFSQQKAQIEICKYENHTDCSVEIDRNEFIQICDDLYKKIFCLVRDTLKEVNIGFCDISEVLLSGDSVKLPNIREFFARNFLRAYLINLPDDSTAIGCSIHSAVTSNIANVRIIKLSDCCSYNYSFENSSGATAVSINKHSEIPLTSTGVLKATNDYQHCFTTYVYESLGGGDNKALVSESCLRPTLRRSKGEVCFNVIMKIDENGLFSFTVTDRYSHKEMPQIIKSCLTETELKILGFNMETRMKKMIEIKRINEGRRNLIEMVKHYQEMMISCNLNDFWKESEKKEAQKVLASATELSKSDSLTSDNCKQKMEAIESTFAKILNK